MPMAHLRLGKTQDEYPLNLPKQIILYLGLVIGVSFSDLTFKFQSYPNQDTSILINWLNIIRFFSQYFYGTYNHAKRLSEINS